MIQVGDAVRVHGSARMMIKFLERRRRDRLGISYRWECQVCDCRRTIEDFTDDPPAFCKEHRA